MTYKLDIFDTLKQIDKRNITFFDNLPDEAKKGFAPIVITRWFSSGNPYQLELTSVILNPMTFKLYKHPSLMYKLMVACSDGKDKRYAWIKKKGKDKSAPTAVSAISEYYVCSKSDAHKYRTRLSLEDVVEMAEELGYDKDQIKKIKTELK